MRLGLLPAWLGIIWATGWSVWAVADGLRPPRWQYVHLHIAHSIFCVAWLVFVSLRAFKVVEGQDYLDLVAPFTPVLFFFGPWSIWSIAHWEARASKRRSTFRRRRNDD